MCTGKSFEARSAALTVVTETFNNMTLQATLKR